MSKIAYNPYLPGYEYVPDGEPYVFGDRVYIFGSHDRSGGEKYCMEDYVCWSASVNDLAEWRYEGVIYRKEQDPDNPGGVKSLNAPDVVRGNDGRYYLYYETAHVNRISVAVCDTPAGEYEYYGTLRYPDGRRLDTEIPFDPAVINDDGQIRLYYGFCPHFKMSFMKELPDTKGAMYVELASDMLTCKGEPVPVIPSFKYAEGTGFEEHPFFEAASAGKINETYYLVYASKLMHELCYATSKYPDRGFVFGGTIVSNGDVGFVGITEEKARNATANTHGGMIEISGQWYIFYHRHTNGTQFSRQGCAEPITIHQDGSIGQVEMTSCGLNGGIMPAKNKTPAYCACNLYKGIGGAFIRFGPRNVEGPYVTENHNLYPETERIPYVSNITDTSVVGFRYLIFDGTESSCVLSLRGKGKGIFSAYADDEGRKLLGSLFIDLNTDEWTDYKFGIEKIKGKYPFRLVYSGQGETEFNFFEFM